MSRRADDIVSRTLEEGAGITDGMSTLPAELQASIAGHRRTLEGLAESLLAAGLSEDGVRSAVSQVFQSYSEEFARTIIALREQSDANR